MNKIILSTLLLVLIASATVVIATPILAKKSPEYKAGYEAGVRQSNIDDDPDSDITPSQITCKGGQPGSDWCRGYQQGYVDNDRAMVR
jgi:hypothetical protein